MNAVISYSSNSAMRGIIIELPLKPRKKTISLRLDEDVLAVLDMFATLNAEVSRTLLMTKIVEALAKGIKESNYNAYKLELKFYVENPETGGEEAISVVIPLKSKKE